MAYELNAFIGLGSPPPHGAVALPQNTWLYPVTMDIDPPPWGMIAHVNAHFFGGVGTQSAVLYKDGREIRRYPDGYDAINQVLRALGIAAELPKDEFDTLGLGRYRHTEQWAAAAKQQ